MKRVFDILMALGGLLALSPVLLPVVLLIFIQDFKSPFYIAARVGRRGRDFRMVKLRSMIVGADKSGVASTASDDKRITWIGRFVRKTKLDEVAQLWNVLLGQMSLVGPRPNVRSEVDLYTSEELKLLDERPGITDLASIVFADEGEILAGSSDPDLRYNQVIRPWKSRLGLVYVEKRSFFLDLEVILLTAIGILSRRRALAGVVKVLGRFDDVDPELKSVAARTGELRPHPPPGAGKVVESA